MTPALRVYDTFGEIQMRSQPLLQPDLALAVADICVVNQQIENPSL